MSIENSSISDFIRQTGWGDAVRQPLAGDASRRRYERLSRDGRSVILMIAPQDQGENIRPFIQVANHLREIGLSAPSILDSDAASGLLLLEDLGDALYSRIAAQHPKLEPLMYRSAADVLVHIHKHPVPAWSKHYGKQLLIDMSGLAFEWYAGIAVPIEVIREFENLLEQTERLNDVLVLRDYHAENLLWLPDREGVGRVGLLDFQDAMSGHRAYDLVSLVEDARRDLGPGVGREIVGYYIEQSGVSTTEFQRDFALLGTQRNMRILGVFARLAIRDGKPNYLNLIPRVWGHLLHDLSHPSLSFLRDFVMKSLPEPDAKHLHSLNSRCTPTR